MRGNLKEKKDNRQIDNREKGQRGKGLKKDNKHTNSYLIIHN